LANRSLTDKKATNQANNLIIKKPLIVLPIFREKFPCVTTKLDTNIIWKDTTISIDCPEIIPSNEYFIIHDTIKRIKKIKVPITLPIQIQKITKTIKDSSYGKEQAIKLDVITIKADNLQIDKDKLQKGINRWRLWFLLLAFSNILLIALKLYFKNFTNIFNKLKIK
jgi:hypothetical protein